MRGFVYALVNSSLPGLVKVGKTTRRPSERVKELSSATGVPTPFVVAFEREFADCDGAERYIHAQLDLQGWRQSSNREFFRADASDVIRTILAAPDSDHRTEVGDDSDTLTFDYDPATELLVEANAYFEGKGSKLQDFARGISLLQKAAKLDSAQAHFDLGYIYANGLSVEEDQDRALEHYHRAAELGDPRPYAYMGRIYQARSTDALARYDKHAFQAERQNVLKCAELFVSAWNAREMPEADYDQGLVEILMTTLTEGAFPNGHSTEVQDAFRARATALLPLLKPIRAQYGDEEPDEPIARKFGRADLDKAMRWLRAATKSARRANEDVVRP